MGADTVTLEIDGIAVVAAAGSTIMDACDAIGVYVPRLCAYPGLDAVGDCGLCFVRVDGTARRACSVTVAHGMEVDTADEETRGFRTGSMKAILGDHPHVCLTCPARDGCARDECTYGEPPEARCCAEFDHCEIAAIAASVGALGAPPAYVHRSLGGPVVDHTIRRDPDLCVGCGRCVAACDTLAEAGSALDLTETSALRASAGGVATVREGVDPGADEDPGRSSGGSSCGEGWEPASYLGRKVAVPKGADLRSSGCTFCGACVMVCPSGALVAAGARGAAWLAKRRERTTLRRPVLPPPDRRALAPDALASVPASAGVFRLYSVDGALLQVTGAADLAAALRQAALGELGAAARSFDFELEPLYTQRESELLARHLQAHGVMPQGNDPVGALFDDVDPDDGREYEEGP